ncbi:phage tail protein [Acinetobacter gerneri]|uniref:Phage tail protein n=1 Tax=Acinetobacter gerneri TaxID=202952 RepID=A0AAW8JIE9_9GAMM|nr:phage tail protein [Acinetobacter gerneri]MDQ9009047.1 phage tail protein [Acinetobacter gerneri]MDQ9013151.1 phage tail protein [Acinetobacter gerneri]MDQ9024588.1 phage tail protein [Acinetobacter gerneri]MDQ9051823.1 phage tail protein [Acinetobacter gerneri]MDQ9059196.1 phage tail protein [Acinetobacter gerneri]
MGGIFGTTTVSTSDKRINSMRIQQSAYGLTQPLVYGKNRVAANMFWYGDFKSTAHTTTTKSGGKGGKTKTKNTTYTYSASLMLGLCENKIKDIGIIWRDKEQIVQKTEGGVQLKPIDQIGFELFNGDHNPVWGYLASKHPDEAVHYPFLGYVACANYDLGGSAALSNHNFEVISNITFSETIHDANPADVIEDFITNPRYGAAPSLNMADLSEFRTYCAATNLLISPALTEQREAFEIINEIVEAVNCAVVPSPDGLKIRSYGDSAVTGNGVTFTPNLEPVYHLTDDDFLGEDQPVRVRRSRDTDAYNHCQIEYVNRFNQYNTETVEAKDQANIEMFGLRTQDPVKHDFFCEPKIARHAVQLLLQRKLYVRNEYEFELGWKYCRLEPMDIVTITDESLGLNQFPVRITRVEEDEEGILSITAEELAVGSRSAVEYDLQSSNGYQGGNEEPGNVNAPAIFEPPLELTGGKNQIWVAASGGINWGGCNVWASIDNTTYEMIGTIYGSARYGTLVSAIDADDTSMQVQLNTSSQIFGGTIEDAEVDATLCKVGDEYINYIDATLDGSGRYTLSSMLRGRFDDASSHNAGESFVRIDRAIFEYEFNSNMVGKQIYLKFTSFNGLEQKEETLDEVTAYSYTINGGRPAGVKGLSLQSAFEGTSFKVQWQSAAGATGYIVQIWSNGVLLRTVDTTNTDYSYSMDEAKIDGIQRAYTVRVASKNGSIVSTFAELNISNPVPPQLLNVYTSATADSITVTWIPSEVPDLKDYQVWISTNANFDPDTTAARWTGTENACTITSLQSTTTYYVRVAARDVWKPTSWNYSTRITQATADS